VLAAAAVRTGPQLINKLKQGVNVDTLKTLTSTVNSLSLPTPMGVPLTLNVSAAAILKLEGLVKANSLPELSHFTLRRPYMTRKIELISDIKPRYRTNETVHAQLHIVTHSDALTLLNLLFSKP